MALDDNALITLAQLKTYVDEDGSTFDTLFEMLINQISTLMQELIDQDLRYATYTDQYFNGTHQQRLYLPHRPIISITSLEEDDVSLTEGEDEDFVLVGDEGYLHKVDAVWNRGTRNIKITYKAGYKLSDALYFDSGSEEPAIGDTLVGASSSAEGVVSKVVLDSGSWSGGDAEGYIEFSSSSGTFTNDENVNIKDGSSNVMTVDHPDSTIWLPKDLQLACMKQVAYEWKQQKGKLYGETNRSYPDGSIAYVPVKELLDSVKQICERYQRFYI